MGTDGPWTGALSLMPGAAVYRGPGGPAAMHAHHAVQIMAAVDQEIEIEDQDGRRRVRGVVIPPNLGHRIDTQALRFALILVEPNGPRGRALLSALSRPDRLAVVDGLAEVVDGHGEASANALLTAALGALGVEEWRSESSLSVGVERAVRLIQERRGVGVDLAAAALAAHLSASRLSHVFSSEIGVPFGRYRLWVRLHAAADLLAEGMSATEAAAECGFSDSAHMTRTFRAMLGLPPSVLKAMRWEAQG